MKHIPSIRESAEVHFWQDGADRVEEFDEFWRARIRFERLMNTDGAYNLKLIKYVTTAEVLDKGYERNVSMLTGGKP